MPCIQTCVNVKIPQNTEEKMKTEFGKAISLLPGKSESWLMVSFEDACRLYFKGSAEPAAFLEVKIFGSADESAYSKLTARLTEIVNRELGIDPSRIYVKYEEVSHWGWNGSNF